MVFLRFSFYLESEGGVNGIFRTGSLASAAPYALGTVDVLSTLDLHRTDLFALVASHAFFLVQIHLIEAESREQSIDCTEGTQVLTERPVYQRR